MTQQLVLVIGTTAISYLEDGPQNLGLSLALVRLRFSLAHLLLQLVQRWLDELPTFWRRLLASTEASAHTRVDQMGVAAVVTVNSRRLCLLLMRISLDMNNK